MKRLVQEIVDAFKDLTCPSDSELLHPDCFDDVDILEFYGGVRWQEMTDTMVVRGYAAPAAFSPRAFQYYLPAYLIWTLKNPDSPEYAGESLLLALDPASDGERLHAFKKSKFQMLTPQQVSVVRKFLRLLSDHAYLGELAEQALANYWADIR